MIATSIAPSLKQVSRFVLVVALGLVAIASAKAGGLQYTSQQKSACMSDAFRFCMSEIPDAGRVRTCMIANKSSLSPGCQAMFRS